MKDIVQDAVKDASDYKSGLVNNSTTVSTKQKLNVK